MSEYNGGGVEDDRVAQAARRIVRQYHLEQSDRSEDSASDETIRQSADAPDNIHGLRLALDDMAVKIEHMQRLMMNREALFMAALERIERNLAKSDGLLDALAADVARIDARPAIEREAIAEDQRSVATSIMREFSGMMALGRALLDEVRMLHDASLAIGVREAEGTARAG